MICFTGMNLFIKKYKDVTLQRRKLMKLSFVERAKKRREKKKTIQWKQYGNCRSLVGYKLAPLQPYTTVYKERKHNSLKANENFNQTDNIEVY